MMPTPAQMTEPNRNVTQCPVCGAGFRGHEICPRCGTDLQALMRLLARAWALRQRSRAELRRGNLRAALRNADAAWKLQQRGVRAPDLPIAP